MKTSPRLLLAALCGFTLSLRAVDTPAAPTAAPAKSPADVAYEAVWTIYKTERDPELRKTNPREYFKQADKQLQAFIAAARAFAEKYPQDSRRYEGWVQSSFTGPSFITGFKPEFDARPGYGSLISDDAAVLAFRSEQIDLLKKVIEAVDATPRERGGAMVALIVDSGTVARIRGEKFEVSSLRPVVDRAVEKFNDERVLPIVDVYLDRARAQSPAEADALVASLQSRPAIAAAIKAADEKRAAAAAEKTKKLTALSGMKFTAADGREVEIAKLKGKVVLIDFWATWCGPCKEEIPNVVANYNKYHDKGFEVIGITLENPGSTPKDTPEQLAAKLEKAKAKMLEFTQKNGMPWPQYFDGKWWKNDYAVQFGIDSIPAMFLLDQNGNIVSQEARGPKLEAEIKRLLKL